MKAAIEKWSVILAAFVLGYGLFWWFGVFAVAFIWLYISTPECNY